MAVTHFSCPAGAGILSIYGRLAPQVRVQCPKCKETFSAAELEAAAAEARRAQASRDKAKRSSKKGVPVVTILLIVGALVIGTGAAAAISLWSYISGKNSDGASNGIASLFGLGNKPAPVTYPRPAQVAFQPLFEDWEQDMEAAKRRAAADNKDIFVLFDGSDWCPWSLSMAQEIRMSSSFLSVARSNFVLVFIDFPQLPGGRAKVRDAGRNERLAKEYGIQGYPTIVLTDAQGRPYAVEAYGNRGADKYLAELLKLRKFRDKCNDLLAKVDKAQGLARLTAAKDVVAFLNERSLV